MNKTLNVLISGVTMAATMAPGGSYYRNMAAFTAGDSMRNMINVKNRPRLNSLSATEQIQLAGLVDDLQGKLVKTYHTYKNGLQSLIHAHQTTLSHNDIYRKALQSGNDLAILAAGSAYYKSLLAEAEIRQEAKINRLRLERLAGEEVLSDLKLSVVFNADLHGQESLVEPPSPQQENQSMETPLKPSTKSSSVSTPAKTSEASSLTPEPDRIDHDETH
ncbi:MAG: hypothetical protein K2X66_04050 [Cyanobacteria bacterium]|nr:hypothetical protein [Cyanobacteriota bacterium]